MSSIALVTGGNRGIGLAIAQSLQKAGHDVVVTYRTGAAPTGFKSVQMDVTSTESVDAGFASIEEQWGTPEIVVANAGITKDGLVLRMSEDDFEGTIVLEELATLGLLDDFYDAVDSDDIERAIFIMRKAQIDSSTIKAVVKIIQNT